MIFRWDPAKAAQNIEKHEVSFQEAASVFDDDLSTTIPDPDHSEGESRYLILGLSHRGRMLVVSHTEDRVGIRIISARLATRREIKEYEN